MLNLVPRFLTQRRIIIISELFLAESKKTIQPLSKAGFAGGAKYRCQVIHEDTIFLKDDLFSLKNQKNILLVLRTITGLNKNNLGVPFSGKLTNLARTLKK